MHFILHMKFIPFAFESTTRFYWLEWGRLPTPNDISSPAVEYTSIRDDIAATAPHDYSFGSELLHRSDREDRSSLAPHPSL
jgi:hypothetical protein